MRRRPQQHSGVPAHLWRFDPADWLGVDDSVRLAAWRAARLAWTREGNSWPGGALAMIRQHVAVSRRVCGFALPPSMGPDGEWLATAPRDDHRTLWES